MSLHWDRWAFLRNIYAAISKRDFRDLEAVIAATPTPPDLEAALDSLTIEAWRQVARAEVGNRKRANLLAISLWIGGGLLVLYTCLTLAAGLGCWFRADGCKQVLFGTYTPTLTPTPTPTPTRTPTPTPTATPTDTPTPTPIPPSTYLVCDSDEATGQPACDPAIIHPRLPLGAEAAWILDEQNADVQPPLTDAATWKQTTSGDANSIQEVLSYTGIGIATLTWNLDVPLNAGLYQLYVLDTREYSGGYGPQEFVISLDGVPTPPVRGRSSVIFGNQTGLTATDDWLPLGAYDAAQAQRLSVAASIPPLGGSAVFAVDRLLIVKVSEAQRRMIICPDGLPQCLPLGRELVSLLDDDRAIFFSIFNPTTPLARQYQGQLQTDAPAWNDSFRSLDMTGENWKVGHIGKEVFVDWAPAGRLPPGKYELYIWVPATHATAKVSYTLLADGQPAAGNPVEVEQHKVGSQWLSLGLWEFAAESAVGVRMTVAQQAFEIGLDAVAIVWVGPTNLPTATPVPPTAKPVPATETVPPTAPAAETPIPQTSPEGIGHKLRKRQGCQGLICPRKAVSLVHDNFRDLPGNGSQEEDQFGAPYPSGAARPEQTPTGRAAGRARG